MANISIQDLKPNSAEVPFVNLETATTTKIVGGGGGDGVGSGGSGKAVARVLQGGVGEDGTGA
jgi:hypothetical protein